MSVKRGNLYLIDFGSRYQSELGKIRPALIWQSDYINDHLDAAPHPSIIVIPTTTDLKGGRFRYLLPKRDRLEQDSELILNWLSAVDLSRLHEPNPLTALTSEEMHAIRQRIDFVMGYLD